ncbi:MAG: thioredoxin domain-containing protein [Rhodanobacteraceae bacterium]
MPNRLADETSPYLRQHADNPVDWWAWSDAALATARAEKKPILLSIGYAACHWCHVMAHESFEDAETARVMNALYVNIKVDREERPDVDKVYQLAHQALARRGGGWPLTVFLTPDDLLPFFAGTYFPKTPRYGMPAFTQVLEGVRRWFDQKPDDVRAQNASLATFLAEHGRTEAHADVLDDTPIRAALARIEASFDQRYGGHTGAPKFPHTGEIELLLANGASTVKYAEMAHRTLAGMADGGLTDHVGGGFFRYCVDERWEIPHFEKMLYDNAQLLPLYAREGASSGNRAFTEAAHACGEWLIGEMAAPDGGFWSSLDADSEGEEGRFYVWDREDIRTLLDDAECRVVEHRFGLDLAPNFENHAWHLRVVHPFDETAAALSLPLETARDTWLRAREQLATARALRVRPGLDDKILTAWNALMIAGIARASRGSREPSRLLTQAERALDFLHAHLWKDGRLYASHARGTTKFPAYLDDHAFLLDALLAMLQVRWKARDLEWSIALANALLDRFEDQAGGGFYFTAHDAEALPQRPKPFFDESLPAGNGVAARALLRLGHLLGEARYLDAAERTLRAGWPILSEMPSACCTMLLALDEFLRPHTHVVIRYQNDDTAAVWRAELAGHASKHLDAYLIPNDAAAAHSVLAGHDTTRSVVAYVCEGVSCGAPIGSLDELRIALAAQR